MKKIEKEKTYYFVDESGDSVFYNKKGEYIVGEGASKFLMLGFIETTNPESIRKSLSKLHNEIISNNYYKGVPSFENKTKKFFHAKDDIPEIRKEVFNLIKTLDFKAHFIFARKHISIFAGKRIDKKESKFYAELIKKLFTNRIHLAAENYIYFEKRGNKEKQQFLESAVNEAKDTFIQKWDIDHKNSIKVQAQTKTGEPCLQVIDYVSWAVQRLFKDKEEKFYKFLEEKITFVWDIYDFANFKQGNTFYNNKKNLLSIEKISPL